MTPLLLALASSTALLQEPDGYAIVTQVTSPQGRVAALVDDNPRALLLRAELHTVRDSVSIGWSATGQLGGGESHVWHVRPSDYLGGYVFYFGLVPDEGKTLTTSPHLKIVTATRDSFLISGTAADWSETSTGANPFYGGLQITTWDSNAPKLMTGSRDVFGVQRWSLRSPGGVRKTVFSLEISD